MPGKTIQEAVRKGLSEKTVEQIERDIVNHIRDYFAHEVMKLPENATAKELFDLVFKHIPAFESNHTPGNKD